MCIKAFLLRLPWLLKLLLRTTLADGSCPWISRTAKGKLRLERKMGRGRNCHTYLHKFARCRPHVLEHRFVCGEDHTLGCFVDRKKLRKCRAAKFTKNKNDQWNHAGVVSIFMCASFSLKRPPRNDGLSCGAWCMGSEPPKCRRLHASGILSVRIWADSSSFSQAKASTSLV